MSNTINNEGLPLSDAEKQLLDVSPVSDRETQLSLLQDELDTLPADFSDGPDSANALARAEVSLQIAAVMLDLDRKKEAWDFARYTIEVFVAHDQFEKAVLACQYTYLADQFDAVPAIGQAAWLAVTYPVDPHLTATILDHVVEETPDDSDGAAVAAATAHYVADLRRADGDDELSHFTGAMLARVARRHSNIESQHDFEGWVRRLELDEPDKFLVRLRNVIDVMVQFDWWFDREMLQSKLPQ